MSGRLITESEVNSFLASGASRIDDMSAVERYAFAEALGRAGTLIGSGYRDVNEYLRHVERDMREGTREVPPSLRSHIGDSATASLR